ncbi:hypothetical protein MRB53_042125 [Persea americana]|nr:hypothetical protein MRB53_042125 [Persea americana]
MYTSPHVVHIRERISIDSAPVSRELFAQAVSDIWHAFGWEDPGVPRSSFFRTLTVLAFHIFIQQGVNAAIVEVGIGGERDATNIVNNPVVTGISSLGMDHISSLGPTIENIAWHKSGIFKSECPAFTVEQRDVAMDVLRARALEKGAHLTVVPTDPRLEHVPLVPNERFQRLNASLAIAMTDTWLQCQGLPAIAADDIMNMAHTKLRGRFEVITTPTVQWYLDGAHTMESIAVAVQWLKTQCVSMTLASCAP